VTPRLFVTGTDTGVGKTVVTAALAAAAPGPVAALKPLATGVPPGEVGEDAALLALGAGGAPPPYMTWATPVSPHRAARESGRRADRAALLAWVAAHARAHTLVEGVGGWRVPVDPDGAWGIPEIARGLGWPVLLVAGNRLGVLNHALLTVDAVRAAGLPLVGLVLNDGAPTWGGDDQAPARARNLEDLRALLDIPVARFPRLRAMDRPALAAAGRQLRAQFA
jgi:dethiobiotin synthetase